MLAVIIINEKETGYPVSGSSVARAQRHMPCLPHQTGR